MAKLLQTRETKEILLPAERLHVGYTTLADTFTVGITKGVTRWTQIKVDA